MIIVNLVFDSVQVANYGRDDLTVRINFSDGKQSYHIDKRTNLENTEEISEQMFNEAKKMVKDAHAQRSSDFLGDVVMVRFNEDEEKLSEKMHNAFSRIKEEMRKLKTSKVADNYLQRLTNFNNLKISL